MKKKRVLITIASAVIVISSIPIQNTVVYAENKFDITFKTEECAQDYEKLVDEIGAEHIYWGFTGVLKVDRWTTSYYIGKDSSIIYPLQCAAIYDDMGYIQVYFWNTSEWPDMSFKQSFVNDTNMEWNDKYWDEYNFSYDAAPYLDNEIHLVEQHFNTYSVWREPSASYPVVCEGISYTECSFITDKEGFTIFDINGMEGYHLYNLGINRVNTFRITCEGSKTGYRLNTTEDAILEENSTCAYILNHTLSLENERPCLLNTYSWNNNDEAVDIYKYFNSTNELEKTNKILRETLNSYGNRAYGDMNNDGFVDGRDASLLLTYYAKTSVGYAGTLDDFIQEQNNEKGLIATLFEDNHKG